MHTCYLIHGYFKLQLFTYYIPSMVYDATSTILIVDKTWYEISLKAKWCLETGTIQMIDILKWHYAHFHCKIRAAPDIYFKRLP